jgi:hypothetical protein
MQKTGAATHNFSIIKTAAKWRAKQTTYAAYAHATMQIVALQRTEEVLASFRPWKHIRDLTSEIFAINTFIMLPTEKY